MNTRLRHAPIELRASTEEGSEGRLRGYASVYDVSYRIGWGLREEIAPGAFADSLAARDGVIPIFYQHDWNDPIGVARATEDSKGVHVEAQLFVDDNERARSVWLAAKAGALREWSIGFYPSTIEVRSADDDSGTEIERIIDGDLAEASVVVRGANPATEMLEVRARALAAEAAFYRAAGGDPDDDPAAIAQAIDAANDALAEALAAGEYETAAALSTAIDMAVDRLLVLFGVSDPDEGDEDDASGDMAESAGPPPVPGYLLDALHSEHARSILRERFAEGV